MTAAIVTASLMTTLSFPPPLELTVLSGTGSALRASSTIPLAPSVKVIDKDKVAVNVGGTMMLADGAGGYYQVDPGSSFVVRVEEDSALFELNSGALTIIYNPPPGFSSNIITSKRRYIQTKRINAGSWGTSFRVIAGASTDTLEVYESTVLVTFLKQAWMPVGVPASKKISVGDMDAQRPPVTDLVP